MWNCIHGMNPRSCDAALVSFGRVRWEHIACCCLESMNTSTLFWYLKHKERTKKRNRSLKCGHTHSKNALCEMRNIQKMRALQSHLPAQVSFLSLRDTRDATGGNGSFTQCTESSSEKLKWLRRGGTGLAFFSLSPSVFARLCLHLYGCLCGSTSMADQRRDVV